MSGYGTRALSQLSHSITVSLCLCTTRTRTATSSSCAVTTLSAPLRRWHCQVNRDWQMDRIRARPAGCPTAPRHSLAMRFPGLLRGNELDALDGWIDDAMVCGIHAMQKFAAKLRYDISAVRNAICEPWSNGQTEGQMNRLELLKRTMYRTAGGALLRARMHPLQEVEDHQMRARPQ